MSGLTHSKYDDSAPTIEDHLASVYKRFVNTGSQVGDGAGFGLDNRLGQLFQGFTVHACILTLISYGQMIIDNYVCRESLHPRLKVSACRQQINMSGAHPYQDDVADKQY